VLLQASLHVISLTNLLVVKGNVNTSSTPAWVGGGVLQGILGQHRRYQEIISQLKKSINTFKIEVPQSVPGCPRGSPPPERRVHAGLGDSPPSSKVHLLRSPPPNKNIPTSVPSEPTSLTHKHTHTCARTNNPLTSPMQTSLSHLVASRARLLRYVRRSKPPP